MNIQQTIEQFQHAVVQIATKTGTGTGFYLQDYNLIVTNNHVVRDNQRVTVKARSFEKKLAKVVFTDEKHDLAFLLPPVDMSQMQEIELGDYTVLQNGDSVVAIGHPYGLNYTATQGVISRVDRVQQGIKYIQIDAAINPGNSGGPLIDERGKIVGVNTFIIKGGDNLGFALPVNYLTDALDQYMAIYGTVALRCPSCNAMVTEENLDSGKYCPNCGTDIDFPKAEEPDEEPISGIAKTIEDTLESLGFNKELARNGQNKWEIEAGKARVKITYNRENYFIISDAYLCKLPKQGIPALYTFLLQENYKMKCKLFSLQGENIVLSSLIYDLDINQEKALPLFRELFERADYYDEYLINTFGCQPMLEEN